MENSPAPKRRALAGSWFREPLERSGPGVCRQTRFVLLNCYEDNPFLSRRRCTMDKRLLRCPNSRYTSSTYRKACHNRRHHRWNKFRRRPFPHRRDIHGYSRWSLRHSLRRCGRHSGRCRHRPGTPSQRQNQCRHSSGKRRYNRAPHRHHSDGPADRRQGRPATTAMD